MGELGHDGLRVWGEVLERLRVERGLSLGEVCRRAMMERSQYYRICHGAKDGPSFMVLDRLLRALDCTWEELGRTYDAMKAGAKRVPHTQELKAAVGDRLSRAPSDSRKPPTTRGIPPRQPSRRGSTKTHP